MTGASDRVVAECAPSDASTRGKEVGQWDKAVPQEGGAVWRERERERHGDYEMTECLMLPRHSRPCMLWLGWSKKQKLESRRSL